MVVEKDMGLGVVWSTQFWGRPNLGNEGTFPMEKKE